MSWCGSLSDFFLFSLFPLVNTPSYFIFPDYLAVYVYVYMVACVSSSSLDSVACLFLVFINQEYNIVFSLWPGCNWVLIPPTLYTLVISIYSKIRIPTVMSFAGIHFFSALLQHPIISSCHLLHSQASFLLPCIRWMCWFWWVWFCSSSVCTLVVTVFMDSRQKGKMERVN